MTPRLLLLSAILPFIAFSLLVPAATGFAQETVIYRCTDAGGAVTMQNKPCGPGMQQQVRKVGVLPTAPAPAPRRPRCTSSTTSGDQPSPAVSLRAPRSPLSVSRVSSAALASSSARVTLISSCAAS